jgi:hypothetical protein
MMLIKCSIHHYSCLVSVQRWNSTMFAVINLFQFKPLKAITVPT